MSQESHLPLEELIAAARGEALAPPAATHLAECGDCAAEVCTWSAVTGGIRVLAARSTPRGDVIGQVLATIDRGSAQGSPVPPRHGTPLGWRSRRYAWLTAAAAAILLAAGGYGVSTAFGPAGGGPPATQANATLTATGCSALKATGGTLTSVSGSALTIRTAGGPVTVTTSADTKVLREAAGTLSDVTDGSQVTVFGTNSGGTIDAKSVALGSTAASQVNPPAGPLGHGGLSLRLGIANGTVTGATSSGFTVDEPDRTRVQVTTSPATTVLTLEESSTGQLETGKLTSAVGTPGPNGTLAATMVEQDDLTIAPALPSLPGNLPKLGSAVPSPSAPPSLGNNLGSLFSGLGCSQGAITTTYLMSLASTS